MNLPYRDYAIRDTLDERRPDDGAMGVLYQQRRSLYWLVVIVAVLAYAGLVAFLATVVALVGLGGARAILATLSADALSAYAWLGYAALSFGAVVGSTYLAATWASQYEVRE